jgi:hypothetical protein
MRGKRKVMGNHVIVRLAHHSRRRTGCDRGCYKAQIDDHCPNIMILIDLNRSYNITVAILTNPAKEKGEPLAPQKVPSNFHAQI